MSNKLLKSKTTSYSPGNPGYPAFGGSPYVPAHCVGGVTAYIPVLSPPQMTFVSLVGSSNVGVLLPPGGVWVYDSFGAATGYMAPVPGSQTITYQATFIPGTVCYPEQPAQPPIPALSPTASQVFTDLQMGWNAGARAIRFLPGSGRVEFKAPVSSLGVVSGLNDSDNGTSYVEIEHGWYISKGKAKVLENGVQVFDYGAFSDGDLFAVERTFSAVNYLVNGNAEYSSTALFSGQATFDASLYLGDDYIYDPAVVDYDAAESSLQPLMAVGADYAYAFAAVSLEPLEITSYETRRSAVSLQPLVALGSEGDYAGSSTSLQPLTTFASSGLLAPDYGISSTYLLPLFSVGVENMPPYAVVVATSLEPLKVVAAEFGNEWGFSRLKPLTSSGSERIKLDADMPSWAFTLDQWYPPSYKFTLMNSSMTVAVVMFSDLAVDVLLNSLATVTADSSAAGDMSVLISTLIQAGFSVPVLSSDNQVWVVSEAGQTSRYEDYAFNSFGVFGGKYYGTKEDGVYLLEGDTDEGNPIRASINFGKLNFGSSLLKHVHNCYLGVSSTGKMYLKVTANGQSYVYLARSSSEELSTQRVDIGKGIRANYMVFELLNNQGCDFELDTVEFIAIPSTSRRI